MEEDDTSNVNVNDNETEFSDIDEKVQPTVEDINNILFDKIYKLYFDLMEYIEENNITLLEKISFNKFMEFYLIQSGESFLEEKEYEEYKKRLVSIPYYQENVIKQIHNPGARTIKFKDERKLTVGISKKDITSYRGKVKNAF